MIKLLNTDDYQNMISSPNITNQILIDQEAKIHEDIETQLKKDFITLFKRCFVVEVEPTDVQKVTGTGEKGSKKGKGKGKAGGKDEEVKSNKSGPEFTVTVAILCARGLEWTNVMKPVKAKLQYEDNQRAGGGLVSGELSVPQVAIGKDGVADFRKQKIIKFVRPEKNKKEEQVTSERYRIVFETNLSIQNPEISIELKTMSLPIAIITGSNQANSSHGALLWYCYNTDPYLLHTLPPSIPTEKFKEMIQACFKYLDGRPLRNDEMDFLLAKLFKQDDTQVNPVFKHEVKFEDFEVTNKKNPRSTEDKSIPFWRWLQAILNLIEFFLLKPWQDGVIHGFVSRQRTDELLRREPDGVFLLRFSESRVVGDGQNKNLTGALVAAFSLGGGKTIHGLPLTVESYFNKYSLFAVLNGIQNAGKGRHLLKKLYGTQTTIKDFKALYNDKCDKKDKTEENNSRYPNWSEQTLLMLSDKMNEMMNIDDEDDDDDDDYDDDNSVSNGESKRKIPRVRQDSMSSSVHSPETPNNTFEQEFHTPMDETASQGSSIPSNAVDNLLATHNQHSVPSTSTFTFTPFQNSMILQGSIVPSVTMCSSEAFHQQTIGQMSSPTNQTSDSFPNPSLSNVSPVHNVMQSPTNTPNPMKPGCQYPTPIVYGETTWETVSRLSSQNSLPNNIDSSSIPLTAQFFTLNGPDNIDEL